MSRKKKKPKSQRHLRIAVLISGTGTGLQNLIDRIADGRLPHVQIALVISSRSDTEGVQRANVQVYLGKDPRVLNYADAPPERGGWGATLVWLRLP